MRCAVVSSSTELLGSAAGPLIDSHDLVVRINFAPTTGTFGSDVGRRTNVVVANWPTVLYDVDSKMSRFLNELNELNETSRPRPACLSDFARMWRMHDDVRSALASTVPLLLTIDPAVAFHAAKGAVDSAKPVSYTHLTLPTICSV